jgi:hypothetical protein
MGHLGKTSRASNGPAHILYWRKLFLRPHPILFPNDFNARWPKYKQTFVARLGPRTAERRIACSHERIVNIYAPAIHGNHAAIIQDELGAMALAADDHDGSLTTPYVPIRVILVSSSQTAPFVIENIFVRHVIKE